MKKTGLLLTISTGFFLNACSIYKSDFECDPVNGISCKSLSQINEMHENGKLNKKLPVTASKSDNTSEFSTDLLEEKLPQKFLSGKMTRSPEKVQRVWISGYEDKEGVYHGPKYIYMVVQKGYWIPTLDSKEKKI